MSLRPLREHQQAALDGLRASFRAGKRRPMLSLATGSGKTVVGAHVVAGAHAKGNRVTFCVPALSLVDQTFERFRENGIAADDMGIIQADHPWRRPDAPIQIATAQTLARREKPPTDVVVVDEAHIRFKVYEDWMKESPDKLFIGLSATPFSRGLGKLYDDLIQPITMAGLIARGYLAPPRVFAPTHPDLSGVKIGSDGDYEEGGLEEVMGAKTIVADVVATWLAKAERKPTLCFAVNRAHAQKLHDEFLASHVSVAYIDAFTPREERDEIGRKLKTGEVEVVCNIGCLTTGIDWDVRCISLARPTRSEILFVQIIGRGLRPIYPEGFDPIAASDVERARAVEDGEKPFCIAEGSLVLTDSGLVPIEQVTTNHKLWDGRSWISHGGAVYKGVKSVIGYDGITATPNHQVWTKNGWKTLQECSDGRIRLAQTERDGKAVRLGPHYFQEDASQHHAERVIRPHGSVRVHYVWQAFMDFVLELSSRANAGLSRLQSAGARPEMVGFANGQREGSLYKSKERSFLGLWWTWNRVSIPDCDRSGNMGKRKSWCGSVEALRQNRQRWSLRDWKSKIVDAKTKHVSSEGIRGDGTTSLVQIAIPRSTFCGQYDDKDVFQPEKNKLGNNGDVEGGFREWSFKARVWDIVEAGPFHCFTVSGRLAHNCTILDHSDNHARMGMVDEIVHDELPKGKPPKTAGERADDGDKVALPTECQSCGCLIAPRLRVCPNCGAPKRGRPGVEEVEGELVEFQRGGKRRRDKTSVVEQLQAKGKPQVWGEIRAMQIEFGWSDGRAAHTFRDIFDVWPNAVRDARPTTPSTMLRSWVRSRSIAYAKAKRGADKAQEVA